MIAESSQRAVFVNFDLRLKSFLKFLCAIHKQLFIVYLFQLDAGSLHFTVVQIGIVLKFLSA